MIVQCPSCKSREEINKINKNTVLCKGCGVSFLAKNNRITKDSFGRIWMVKGENKIPVSWRVLRYRAKTGKLSEEQEISKDENHWLKAGDYPELLHLIQGYTGEINSQITKAPPKKAKRPISKLSPPVNRIPKTNSNGQCRQKSKAWKMSVVLAIFAIITAGMFFFPLSKRVQSLDMESQDMRLKNLRLKGELSSAKSKIDDLGKKLLSIEAEFIKVTRSNEEFKRAKSMLEDIKKSIDSNKIYLAVSLAENKLYVKAGVKTLKKYVVSTGKGKTVLKTTGKTYNFLTPRGKRIIKRKQRNPVWLKPNWTWLENGDELPDNISIADRTVRGELGKYRLKLGEGYAIHGTRRGKVTGKKETHGCIRMGRNDLKELYAMTKKGTEVYIY